MRFFRCKSDTQLLNEIIDRQQGRQPKQRADRSPKATRLPQGQPRGSWRFYAPFIVVLIVYGSAAAYFISKDYPALTRAYAQITGQPSQVTAPSSTIAGHASIIDADTIEIRGQRIRLWGIDAPESAQLCQRDGQAWRCGQSAALALADWIGERTANCEHRDIDRYHRIIGRCLVGGTDVSAWLVQNGWAMAFRRYSLDYVLDEDRAKRMRAGIWASEFMPPWEWRAARRAPN